MDDPVVRAIARMIADEEGNPRVGAVAIPVSTLRQWIRAIHRERERQWAVGYEAGYAWGREDKRPYVKPTKATTIREEATDDRHRRPRAGGGAAPPTGDQLAARAMLRAVIDAWPQDEAAQDRILAPNPNLAFI